MDKRLAEALGQLGREDLTTEEPERWMFKPPPLPTPTTSAPLKG
jgi:hypothetical protein